MLLLYFALLCFICYCNKSKYKLNIASNNLLMKRKKLKKNKIDAKNNKKKEKQI